MTEQDQKYLAEKMGIEFRTLKYFNYFHSPGNLLATLDSPVFFFFCFEWSKKQEWWDKFQEDFFIGVRMFGGKWEYGMPLDMIGPRFAEELCEFLKQKDIENKRLKTAAEAANALYTRGS